MTGSRGWLAACKPLEVAHVPSMPEVEASCQLEHYKTKSIDWLFSYLAAGTHDSVKLRVQATSQDPNFIFLMETKLVVSEMDGIKERLNRSQGLVVPSKVRSGGLALLWKKELKVNVQTFSDNHIDAIVDQGVTGH